MHPASASASRPPSTVRCWTLHGLEGSVDVEVTARDDDPLGDVLRALEAGLGLDVAELWHGAVRLHDQVLLSDPRLRHGAVLGLARPPAVAPTAASAMELHVAGGPDAARSMALSQGLHVIGRGSEADVRLADPDVSRRHVLLDVGDGGVTVADLGSTNGSSLGAERLAERARRWSPGSALRLGASTLSLSGAGSPTVTQVPMPGGRTRVHPVRRLHSPRPDVEIALPRPPDPPPPRRLAWAAVLLPAVAGASLAWLLSTPTFLFFALLSPVVGVGTWLADRWSGRRSGRRERQRYEHELLEARRRLAEAVDADVRAAEYEHPGPAAVAAAVRRRGALLWSRTGAPDAPLVVRIGTGPGTTRVTRVGDGSRAIERADHVPVTVDLRAGGGLAVVGPRARSTGVLRALLVQLVALHPPDAVDLLLLTSPQRLPEWTWLRWLPHLPAGSVRLAPPDCGDDADAALRRHLAALSAGRGPKLRRSVVVVDRPVGGRTAAALRTARSAGVLVLTAGESAEELWAAVDATLVLAGETGSTATLHQDGTVDRSSILADGIAEPVAAELARELADLAPGASATGVPAEVRLLDLPEWAVTVQADGATRGTWSRSRGTLSTSLGLTAEGPLLVDLCRDGPHALVAGTTGAGKSELLQALICGLALNHPPDRCSFLLVDYKGGAAFAEAARLPHTVGLLTDLDGQATTRALRSLSAELTRREALLAYHGVPDVAALPEEVELARLVIVVDEFATLAEELPAFVPGLVGIAQRGRSLGVHLVLATQRPAGVVSPEIRANCALRVCLRTTDEADSRDVLGAPDAAFLHPGLPGRGLLRRGSAEPQLFQGARTSGAEGTATADPVVRRWSWPVTTPTPGTGSATAAATDLARVVDALTVQARRSGMAQPHRPWRPPLPDRLEPGRSAARPAGATRLPLGLLDLPDRQTQELLDLDLADGGGVLAVGGPRSGRTTLLRAVLRAATAALPPDRLHVHVVTAGGDLAAEAAGLPHTGTAIAGDDAFRATRLVDRLAEEVAARRSGERPGPRPLLLLLVDGTEEVGALLDEADPTRGSAALLRLVREGGAACLTSVLTADRAVPGGRLAAAARLRLVLPLPDRADYAVAGLPARVVPSHRPPGRALVGEDGAECQLFLPTAPGPPGAGTTPVADPSRVRITVLPPDPALPLPARSPGQLGLTIGPGGDDGTPLGLDLTRRRGVLVVGPPGSGRTSALRAFARDLQARGAEVAWLGHGARSRQADTPEPATWLDAEDPGAIPAWHGRLGGHPGVVVADDVGAPVEWPALCGLPVAGAATDVLLVLSGSAGQLTTHFQGAVAALRRARTALLLRPGPAEADLIGVRLPRAGLPNRPGSGWLAVDGALSRVQVARHRLGDQAGGPPRQSSSSAGPSSCVAYQANS
ncbi:FtsK/SpoIIIE domain-containing protein [Blastococcus sp. TF02A-30]|uniref:FtsK/SpoIIIE domain-containing protein n=1 Tax=Blastococcus sp. TF02A-30 TaxID=2250580 RepID=UPI000DEB7B62|nr:FtsK/SpoIIIE domain-containing protein [Blastococcus sp. TF02A-30]RBY86523.1 hypothetical protein DQ241_13505 [Blastococcus sp. TF02A-30]